RISTAPSRPWPSRAGTCSSPADDAAHAGAATPTSADRGRTYLALQVRGIADICGGIAQPTAGPGAVNHAFVDVFSLVHLAGGVVMGALGLRFLPMLVLAVGWELAEHILKDCIPRVFVHPSQDTLLNSTGDVLVSLLGWLL